MVINLIASLSSDTNPDLHAELSEKRWFAKQSGHLPLVYYTFLNYWNSHEYRGNRILKVSTGGNVQ
jgi:hypothetical protein